jgi:3-oxoacyl-[acyl-carrier protein] reductase
MSRSVLITGGNRGIGSAIARSFEAGGYDVAVGYRSGPAPSDVLSVHCDVTDPDSVDKAFAAVRSEFGTVDIVVANAGITVDKLSMQMSDAEFRSVVDTNLVGAFRVARQGIVDMLEQRWGRLVFLSSAVGMLGSPGQANYAASKTGLIGLVRTLAREVGSRGITANAVAPGLIETDMAAAITDRRRAELIGQTALGRVGEATEVAHVVHFLASEDASYVTGAVVPVSGGLGMGS